MAFLLGALCFGMGLYYLLEWHIRNDKPGQSVPAETKSKLEGKENPVYTTNDEDEVTSL